MLSEHPIRSSFRLCVFLCLFLSLTGYGQEWTALRKFGNETDLGRAGLTHSVTDEDGNTYAVGYYGDKIVLDGNTYQAPGLKNNLFLIKFNRDGQVVWASFINGIYSDDHFSVDKLCVDGAGRVYISGLMTFEAYFGNNVKLIMPPTYGDIPISPNFIAAYDANGTAMWAKFGTSDIAVTPEGKIYSRNQMFNNIPSYGWWKNYIMGYHGDSLYIFKPNGAFDRRVKGYWDNSSASIFQPDDEDLWLQGTNNFGETEFRRYNYSNNIFTDSHTISIPVGFEADMVNNAIYVRGFFGYQQSINIGNVTVTAKKGVNGFYESGFLVKYDMTTGTCTWGRTIWRMASFPTYVAGNQLSGDVFLASEEIGINAKNNITAFSADGDSLWRKVSVSYILNYNGMGTDHNGNIFIVGGAHNGIGNAAQFGPLSFTYNWDVAYWAKISLNYPVPPQPLNLTAANVTTSGVSLSWDNTTDEVGFRIEYKPAASSFFAPLKELPADITSYIADNLKCNTAYEFRVVAMGEGSSSPPSAIATATTLKLATPVIASSAPSGCTGDLITLTAPSGFAKTHWSTGATTEQVTITSGGEYKLVVEDNKQCKSDTAKLTVPYYPYPSEELVSDHITISSVETAGEFQWYRDGDAMIGETSSSITPTESGMYFVSIENHGCSTISDEMEFVFTGVESSLSKVVEVFPVPAHEAITIRFNNTEFNTPVTLALTNLHGQKLTPHIKETDEKELLIDTSTLSPGMYFLRIKQNADVATYKVVIE